MVSFLDRASGWLIIAMMLFSPWAFGTTQTWSIWTMNIAGYTLGALLIAKWVMRRTRAPAASRREEAAPAAPGSHGPMVPWSVVRGFLLTLTILILLYCLIAALNPRATYFPSQIRFDYHEGFIPWLPHSLDSARSWFYFWTYLGLALSFWAVRDWLWNGPKESLLKRRLDRPDLLLPSRVRLILWVLAVNAALVGVIGIFQRLEGSGKLLWLVQPRVNPGADTQFGPYAYRANAAQFFNLIWPAALALWWSLHRSGHRPARRWLGNGAHHLLLFCIVIVAACPILSLSRGGALIAFGSMIAAGLLLVIGQRRGGWLIKGGVLALLSAALLFGLYLQWEPFDKRMRTLESGFAGREASYEVGRRMAGDYPVFGTGPGSFDALYQLYRGEPEEFWLAQMHNDWLETRITFGWIGLSMILLALGAVWLRWWLPGGFPLDWRMAAFFWIAMAGVLIHARWDFPFQIHSIVFVFLMHCAVLSVVSRRSPGV